MERGILLKSVKGKNRWIRIGIYIIFVTYIMALSYFLFFAENYGRAGVMREYHYNLIPFKEIERFIIYRENLGFTAVALNLFGNIAGFVPFGFFVPMLSDRERKWYALLFLCMEFSLAVELTQLIFKVGSFDIDDIILNTVGGMIGFYGYCLVSAVRRKWNENEE